MGQDEMLTITADKWDSDVWGAAVQSAVAQKTLSREPLKLFFYFGADDHWVSGANSVSPLECNTVSHHEVRRLLTTL